MGTSQRTIACIFLAAVQPADVAVVQSRSERAAHAVSSEGPSCLPAGTVSLSLSLSLSLSPLSFFSHFFRRPMEKIIYVHNGAIPTR